MKKLIQIMILLGLCMFATVACSQTSEEKQIETDKQETEHDTEYDTERYQAYIGVLSNLIEKQQWPDGTDALEDSMFGSIYENRFAICDVDKDGGEELLVEITSVSMAGMQTKIFDYDEDLKQVVEQGSCLPGSIFYENGIVYVDALHNQTQGSTIWPFSLFQYDSKKDEFEYVGGAYCEDGDEVIYYISDSDYNQKTTTEEEYETWLNSYLENADEIYIPYETIWNDNVDLLRYYAEAEDAVRGINLVSEVEVLGYDVTGDGKNDSIYIHCEERDEYMPEYGHHWTISVNDEIAYELKIEGIVMLEVRLYQVDKSRSYFAIKPHYIANGDIEDFGLYQMEKGQMKEVCNFYRNLINPENVFHYGAQLQILSKDKLKLSCTNQFNATGHISWEMEFEYKSEGWIQSETEFEPYLYDGRKMTANQEFAVYETTACDKEAFTVMKGEVVTIDKISIKDGVVCFQITNETGKSGWFPDPKEAFYEMNGEWIEGYFEEAVFAG